MKHSIQLRLNSNMQMSTTYIWAGITIYQLFQGVTGASPTWTWRTTPPGATSSARRRGKRSGSRTWSSPTASTTASSPTTRCRHWRSYKKGLRRFESLFQQNWYSHRRNALNWGIRVTIIKVTIFFCSIFQSLCENLSGEQCGRRYKATSCLHG